MAKALQFEGLGIDFSAQITKVDRKKLYGHSTVNITDRNGKECSLATLSDDETHIIPSLTTGQVKLDHNGNHLDANSIKVLDSEGNILEKKPSSFDNLISLKLTENGIEDYLDLNVKSIYQLTIDKTVLPKLKNILEKQKVLEFNFTYRADYEEDTAYLINSKDSVFMVIGEKTTFEYLKLEDIQPDTEEEENDLDFSVI